MAYKVRVLPGFQAELNAALDALLPEHPNAAMVWQAMFSSTHHLNSSERIRLLLFSRMSLIRVDSTSQRYVEASRVSR